MMSKRNTGLNFGLVILTLLIFTAQPLTSEATDPDTDTAPSDKTPSEEEFEGFELDPDNPFEGIILNESTDPDAANQTPNTPEGQTEDALRNILDNLFSDTVHSPYFSCGHYQNALHTYCQNNNRNCYSLNFNCPGGENHAVVLTQELNSFGNLVWVLVDATHNPYLITTIGVDPALGRTALLNSTAFKGSLCMSSGLSLSCHTAEPGCKILELSRDPLPAVETNTCSAESNSVASCRHCCDYYISSGFDDAIETSVQWREECRSECYSGGIAKCVGPSESLNSTRECIACCDQEFELLNSYSTSDPMDVPEAQAWFYSCNNECVGEIETTTTTNESDSTSYLPEGDISNLLNPIPTSETNDNSTTNSTTSSSSGS